MARLGTQLQQRLLPPGRAGRQTVPNGRLAGEPERKRARQSHAGQRNTGALQDAAGPHQWGKFRMEARGNKLTLDVNGERVWEFNELEPAHGYIGVQTEGKAFDFRNLRVQELGPN
jgi:hypothetical protein